MGKTDQVLFETKLTGKNKMYATAEVNGITESIKITMEESPTRKTNEWLAEQLIISYSSSAFMRGFLMLAEQHHIPIIGFECDAIGDAVLKNNIPEIRYINIYPKIYVENAEILEKAKQLIEAAIKGNPADKMFSAIITYHPVLEIKPIPKKKQKEKREVFF